MILRNEFYLLIYTSDYNFMKKDNKTTSLTQSALPENIITISDKTTLPFLSEISCGICVFNKFIESNRNSKENASLGLKDKVTKLREEVHELEIIPKDLIKHLLVHMKKRLKIEEKKLERNEAAKNKDKIGVGIDELKKVFEMTIFFGKKGDFVKKHAHFYFNKNNPFGLHLSEKQISNIAKMLCDNFRSEDGSLLNYITTMRGLKNGFNMDKMGEISFN
jgi:hypothetical protein